MKADREPDQAPAPLDGESRFRRMADAALDVIWITDVEPERVVYVSPSFERIWGRKSQDLYDNPRLWVDCIHPDDRSAVGEAFSLWLAGPEDAPWHAEYRVQRPDGSVRWILEHGVVISEPMGPRRVSGISKDVTDRLSMEAALRESEQRFALSVAGSADGIWDWDLLSGQMFISERAQRLYGLEPGIEIRPRTEWLRMVKMPHEDVLLRRRAIADYIEGRVPGFDGEWRVRHPDGVDRWVRLRGLCVRDQQGRATRFSGSITDIDKRKRSEAALRESEQRFTLAVTGSNDGLWDWDIHTDAMFFSERAQHIYGLPTGTTIRPRQEWRSMVRLHPDDIEGQNEAVARYLAGEAPSYDGEWRVLNPDGSSRWIRIRGVCLRDAGGWPTRMAGSVSDIDLHKRAQAALQQAQRLEAVGTLAGGIAHDFNNILGAILGFGEMALRNTRQGSRLRRDIESILNAGERGRALVDRILAFSRSGVSRRVPFEVADVVHEAVGLLSSTLPAGVLLDLDLHAPQALTLGDPTKVHQVLINLCTNAIQAMPGGGTLRVVLTRKQFQERQPSTTGDIEPGEYLVLTVADSGSGIGANILPRIFDPFFTTKDPGSGTGLGLSLVHGIVSEQGGAIDVATAVGVGSSFTVYFPCSGDAAPPDDDHARTADAPRGAHQQILVVDDEEPLLRLMTENLGALGYVCVGYTASRDALVAFQAHPDRYDAIVTDERMPGLSGTSLALACRETRTDIPIILVSGYVGDDLVARANTAGVNRVLAKPLARSSLALAVAQVLSPKAPPAVRRRPRSAGSPRIKP